MSVWGLLRDLKRRCAHTAFGYRFQNNKGVDVLDRAENYLEYGDLVHPGWSTAEFDPNPPNRDRWGRPIQ